MVPKHSSGLLLGDHKVAPASSSSTCNHSISHPRIPGASQPRLALACPTSQMMSGRPEPILVVRSVGITESQLSPLSQFQLTT